MKQNIKSTLRKLRITLGKIFLDKKMPISTTALKPKKILFLRQDGKVGDYIVSSFIFREIKKQDPTIHIGVVCTTQQAYLFQKNSYIDQLHFVKKKHILDYIQQGLQIAKIKYDVVIDPTIVIRNRDLLFLRLIGAKNYIGYQKSHYQLFNINIEGEYHFSQLYQIALEKAGITVKDMHYDVPSDPQSVIDITTFLKENRIQQYIAINFYGAARIKKVNNENIRKYLDYLTGILQEKPIILLTYPEVTDNLKAISTDYPTVFVHHTQKIFHTIELIRHCSLLISTDTSTVHIAAGLEKKLIAIYKEDNIAFTHWQPNNNAETHILFYRENINEIKPQQIKKEWLNI